MPLTLLEIVNRVQAEQGYPISTTVAGNPDPVTTQLFALANRTLDEMRRLTRWTVCQTEYNLVVNEPIITTGNLAENSAVITDIPSGDLASIATSGSASYWQVAAQSVPQAARGLEVDSTGTELTMTMESTSEVIGATVVIAQDTYPLPTDQDFYQPATFWDRTNRWQLIGPDSAQQDQAQRSGIVAIGPRRHWRQIGPLGDRFRIWPAPVEITQPLQLVYEYVSVNAVAVSGSLTNLAQYFVNDDDQPLLDDAAITMGLKMYFWQQKGFNYADYKNDWIDYLDKLIARDGSAPTLRMARRLPSMLIGPQSVQEGNFPGTS